MNKREWFEDDQFWADFGFSIFNDDHWEAAAEESGSLIELLDLDGSQRIVDLCCGPGRHSLELARRGFDVTGVDRTDEYLEEARGRAEKEGLLVNFVKCDMREFAREEELDVVLNLYTSFGYFENPEDDNRLLDNVFRSLKPGGKLVIEMMGKEVLARKFTPHDWVEYPNGRILILDRKLIKHWSVIWNRWTVINGTERKEHEFEHRLYSGTELEWLLKGSGFSRVDVYGDLAGAPYDNSANRLVVVGIK
jgi:SAM-dependent methyltransferase